MYMNNPYIKIFHSVYIFLKKRNPEKTLKSWHFGILNFNWGKNLTCFSAKFYSGFQSSLYIEQPHEI